MLGSAAVCAGVLEQAVNKAANDKANAPNNNWLFAAFFIGCRIWPAWTAACRLTIKITEHDRHVQYSTGPRSQKSQQERYPGVHSTALVRNLTHSLQDSQCTTITRRARAAGKKRCLSLRGTKYPRPNAATMHAKARSVRYSSPFQSARKWKGQNSTLMRTNPNAMRLAENPRTDNFRCSGTFTGSSLLTVCLA